MNQVKTIIFLSTWIFLIIYRQIDSEPFLLSSDWLRKFSLNLITTKDRTLATITRSLFETALNYKPRILDPNIEEFPCLISLQSLVQGQYRARTGFSLWSFSHRKKTCYYREPLFSLQGPCFHYREWVCSVHKLSVTLTALQYKPQRIFLI